MKDLLVNAADRPSLDIWQFLFVTDRRVLGSARVSYRPVRSVLIT